MVETFQNNIEIETDKIILLDNFYYMDDHVSILIKYLESNVWDDLLKKLSDKNIHHQILVEETKKTSIKRSNTNIHMCSGKLILKIDKKYTLFAKMHI